MAGSKSHAIRKYDADRMDRKLRKQLRIFLVIYAVMTGVVIYDVFRDHIDPLWAVAGFVAGILLGYILKRVNVLSIDPESGTVLGRIDLIGGVLLALYLLFIVVRNELFDDWITDRRALAIFTLSITAGAMLGRVLFTLHGVRGVLDAAGILDDDEESESV